jgi:hypothetical protein
MIAPTEDTHAFSSVGMKRVRQQVKPKEVQPGHHALAAAGVVDDREPVVGVLAHEAGQLVDRRFRLHGEGRRRHQVANRDLDDLAHECFLPRRRSRLGAPGPTVSAF